MHSTGHNVVARVHAARASRMHSLKPAWNGVTCASYYSRGVRRPTIVRASDNHAAPTIATLSASAMLAAFLLVGPTPSMVAAQQQTWTGLARVVDGDTIYIGEQKFRLYGVDAPEKAQSCVDARGQVYGCGLVSKDALAKKVGSQTVRCDRKAVDQYNREVAVCSLVGPFSSEDLNKWLVENGYAVAYKEYSKDYIPVEEAAKAARKGIWSGAFEYPAQWRKEEKAGIPHPPLSAPGASGLPPALASLLPGAGPVPLGSAATPVASAPSTIAGGSTSPTGCGPSVQPIKGNVSSKGEKIYHVPGGQYYERVVIEPEKGEAYFCSAEDAVRAGFRASAK